MNAHTPAAPTTHANFPDFLQAVVAFGKNGSFDQRLVKAVAATGLFEGGASAGGFLVPDVVSDEVWTRVYAMGGLIGRCARQPVTRGSGVKVPLIDETSRADGSRFGGVQMVWTGEGGLATGSKPKFATAALELKKLLGLIYATDELIEDAPALAAFLKRAFTMEAQFKIEDAIINGAGGATPLGILNSDALITVAAEGGQAAGSIVFLNLEKMVGRLWSGSLDTAVWLMSQDSFNVCLQLTNAQGSPVVSMGADGVRRILTIPVVVCEYTPALGVGGDIVLADFSQYLLAERAPGIDSSIHVQFVTDETAFRFRFRADGQPGWKSPITPRNSGSTQSPFVTIAARP